MKPKGRMSAAAFSVSALAPIPPAKPRIAAPEGLTAAERSVWLQIANAMPGGWFRAEHVVLLTRYCQHVARVERIEAALAGLDPIADAIQFRALAALAGTETARILSLARSMRLTHHAQIHQATAGNRVDAAHPVRTPEDDREAVRALVAWRKG